MPVCMPHTVARNSWPFAEQRPTANAARAAGGAASAVRSNTRPLSRITDALSATRMDVQRAGSRSTLPKVESYKIAVNMRVAACCYRFGPTSQPRGRWAWKIYKLLILQMLFAVLGEFELSTNKSGECENAHAASNGKKAC
jgi:hypothetical protein